MPEFMLEVIVLGVSALVGYLGLFVLFQVGRVRTEILLEMKDLEARLQRRISEGSSD